MRRRSRRLKVQPPAESEIEALEADCALVSLMRPASTRPWRSAGRRRVSALALELVPRILAAQTMDVLFIAVPVAGYKACSLARGELGKFLPMLTTAAGNIQPARVFVSRRGSVGLQAIATARRLGGVVSAFDIRPAARGRSSVSAPRSWPRRSWTRRRKRKRATRARRHDAQLRTVNAIATQVRDVDLGDHHGKRPGRKSPRLTPNRRSAHAPRA